MRELRIIRIENGFLIMAQEAEKCAAPRRYAATSDDDAARIVRRLCAEFLTPDGADATRETDQ